MTRVLIGEFGAIFRAGLADLLAEAGCDVVPDERDGRGILERVVVSEPSVVVIDLDGPRALDMARSLATRFPRLTVIACSSLEPEMRVYPPFHAGESYVSPLSPDLLVRASTGS